MFTNNIECYISRYIGFTQSKKRSCKTFGLTQVNTGIEMPTKKQSKQIKRIAHIKSLVFQAGFTFTAIDQQYKLSRGCAFNTLREPSKAGEEAIATALDVEPVTLWPERYDKITGQRLSPQPSANYDRPPTMRQRQKKLAVQR